MKTNQIILLISFLFLVSCNKKYEVKNDDVAPSENAPADTLAIKEKSPKKESINLFTLTPKQGGDIAFLSLSDLYPAATNDTLSLPQIEKMDKKTALYFTFDKNYRTRFLSKIEISETDSLFVYDYAKDKLASFLIKNLKTSAMLNGDASAKNWPYQSTDYRIGFEVNTKNLKGFSQDYKNALVYVGKENPFVEKQMMPIVWKKITAKEYPDEKLKKEYKKVITNALTGSYYFFETKTYQYFLQEYTNSNKIIYARRLIVTDVKTPQNETNEIIIDKLFYQKEGISLSPLNYSEGKNVNQWTGKLFKNKPAVVFGFENASFGCPVISIIDKSNEEIYLQCDNRRK
ncbi:oxidoreductase [Flavobacterium sp. 3-218]